MKYATPTGQPIKFWSHKHDQVLALHLAGLSHEQIGLTVELSPGHVKRVLRDPRAQKALEVMRRRLMGNVFVSVEDKLKALAPQAVKNIADTIDGDFVAGTKAKRHQDDVSFELLARVGFGRKDMGEGSGGGIQLPPEEAKRLVDAIEKSDRAREIITSAEEVDAEVVAAGDVESGENGGGVGGSDGRERADQGQDGS